MKTAFLVPLVLATAAPAQPPAEPKLSSLSGTVVNSVTGAPLRKAEIALANGELPEAMAAMMRMGGAPPTGMNIATKTLNATTDAEGKFRFEQVAPGDYWLSAKKPGFGDEHYRPKGVTEGERGAVRVPPEQAMTGITLKMTPLGNVTGRVLDEDGEPFPGITVSALSYSYSQGHRRLIPVDTGQTNGRGEFSLGKLLPGHYVLAADVQHLGLPGTIRPAPADGSPETAYVSTYMPGVIDAAQAEKVEMTPGGEVAGLTVRMQKSVVVRVKGKLVDEAGQAIRNAQIMLIAGGGRVGQMTMAMVNDAEGKFEITDLQPGSYSLMTMQMSGAQPKMSMEPLFVRPKGSTELRWAGAQRRRCQEK